jgi:hypothetical protein
MKVKVFTGEYGEVVVEFNNWAEGKALNKDIIIHTSVHHIFDTRMIAKLSIVVLYPEGSRWDTELEQPKVLTATEQTIKIMTKIEEALQ